ncbi:hypothetical protein PHYBOEH_009214 [Phytophthora boehmeriae]|uniref:Uncharacterized protein n=1 Tax=Phytophthora boehmeriae TaxID=109152 RepID=A0A8T1X4H3_9STRA|nr:hypothetical protein PHYBOEH_009214 [Phytophthora boehmeriae]
METATSTSSSRALPSASSLLQRSPSASTADSQRPLPRLLPLPPKSPTVGANDQRLLVFLHPNRSPPASLPVVSPRSVTVAASDKDIAACVGGKRRSRDFDKRRTSSASSEEATGGTPRCSKRCNAGAKGRKPTYIVRKEEKGELEEQIRKLQAQIHYLEQTASKKPNGSSQHGPRRTDHKLFEQEMHNHLLREAVRNQHFQLFSAQSALSELTYSIQQRQCPINTFIRLGRDLEQRRSLLGSMKEQKIRDAKQLMDRRTQFMKGPDVHRHVDNAARAFKALCEYAKRLGTSIMPHADDDSGVFHSRLEVKMAEMPAETNFVTFSDMQMLSPCAGPRNTSHEKHKEPLGILVLDSVDEDELLPYRPREFLREDVNAVIMVTKGSRRVPNDDKDGEASEKCEPCLVIKRWILLTLHPNDHGIAMARTMDFLLQTCIRMGEEMFEATREALANPVTADSASSHVDRNTPRRLPKTRPEQTVTVPTH